MFTVELYMCSFILLKISETVTALGHYAWYESHSDSGDNHSKAVIDLIFSMS